jgi:hypothetical protein
VLRLILTLVGPKDWVFTAAVSPAWAAAYRKALADSADANNPVVSITSICAAFSSASRLRWAHDAGMLLSTEEQWIELGKVADVKTLTAAHELFEPCIGAVVRGAAESGCLLKLSWLHCQHSSCCQFLHDAVLVDAGDDIFGTALDEQKVEVATDCIFSKQVTAAAARAGHVHVLSYMREHGCALFESACMGAAAAGQVTALRWLREADCSWITHGPVNRCIATAGAKSGSVQVMQFLHEQSVPFDETTMSSAAAEGHLPVCMLLRSVKCPRNEECCYEAALHGRTEMLQWLFKQGCHAESGEVLRRAAASGSSAIIAFIAGVLSPGRRAAALQMMLNYAGGHQHLPAAQWLRAQGAEWPTALCCMRYPLRKSVAVWSGDVLAWARAEGCTSPTNVQNIPVPAQNGAAPAQNVPEAPAAV